MPLIQTWAAFVQCIYLRFSKLTPSRVYLKEKKQAYRKNLCVVLNDITIAKKIFRGSRISQEITKISICAFSSFQIVIRAILP